MKKIAEERGGKCLSSKYISSFVKLTWQCDKGHTWDAAPTHVKRGTWCARCSAVKASQSRKKTIQDMHTLAKERGGKFLSKKYINVNTKHSWQCDKGHVWDAKPSNIKQGSWCRICARKVRVETRYKK